MMVYDDVQPTEKIRIYDKGVEKPEHYDTYAEFPYAYKYGDIIIPRLDGAEPIQVELKHFVDCIKNNRKPESDGRAGLSVVRILDASQRSLNNQNCLVSLKDKLVTVKRNLS